MMADEKRQDIAGRLRHDAAYEEGNLSEWWSRLQYIVLDEDDFPNPEKVFNALVDLIDRPTCHMDMSDDDNDYDRCPADFRPYVCSRCGNVIFLDFKPHCCPICGAEVLADGR